MTNWTAKCADCNGAKTIGQEAERVEDCTISPCYACDETGYAHPWVAPLLAECARCGGSKQAGWDCVCHGGGWATPECTPCDHCNQTGKRYPQLWRRCPYPACRPPEGGHPNHEDCKGSGWILEITMAGLWDVAGDIGMSSVVDKLPYDMLYDWMMNLTEDQRMEALGKAIGAAEA